MDVVATDPDDPGAQHDRRHAEGAGDAATYGHRSARGEAERQVAAGHDDQHRHPQGVPRLRSRRDNANRDPNVGRDPLWRWRCSRRRCRSKNTIVLGGSPNSIGKVTLDDRGWAPEPAAALVRGSRLLRPDGRLRFRHRPSARTTEARRACTGRREATAGESDCGAFDADGIHARFRRPAGGLADALVGRPVRGRGRVVTCLLAMRSLPKAGRCLTGADVRRALRRQGGECGRQRIPADPDRPATCVGRATHPVRLTGLGFTAQRQLVQSNKVPGP